MKISFQDDGWSDYLYWQNNDKKILKRINSLVKEIIRDPYSGIGKPEPLKHSLSGYWSRRINDKHRIVYTVKDKQLIIIQCKNHY